jgi:glycerol uptake facilitator protein
VKYTLGEIIGTFVFVFIGVGSVFCDELGVVIHGLPAVSLCFALGVTLGILASRNLSDAHINPAVTFSMASTGRLPWKIVPGYILGQFIGAILAGMILYFMFHAKLADFEKANRIVRGATDSVLSARCFGEYFPNPAAFYRTVSSDFISIPMAMFYEFLGTAILLFGVLVITSQKNPKPIVKTFTPLLVGLLVACLIMLIAPYTQAGFNPARDFGPRIVSYFAGWKSVAINGPRGGVFQVYVVAPILGAIVGAHLYNFIFNVSREYR